MLDIQTLHESWALHPLGKNRARGGRVALGGFLFQLYLSLSRFLGRVLEGNRDAQFSFEGLSDLAELKDEIVYLTQIKATLDTRSLRSAVDEALAVWQFLNEQHPELRDRIRFQLAVRSVRSSTPLDIGALGAEKLGLEGEDSRLWVTIREKFLPVQIRGNPKVDLAILLWPHTRRCFALVDALLGRLLALLGENRSSIEITEDLLEIWDSARAKEQPPGRLLGPGELAPVQTPSARIVHGVRPRPQDLREGCFMERPAVLKTAVSVVRETLIKLETSLGAPSVPIFWIVGPSGAGKSVLLLQLTRELVVQGDVVAANYIGELAHLLPRALNYWSNAIEHVLITVDDVYAPENREPELWQKVAEVAFNVTSGQQPWILSCGPIEQLKSFKREVHRHPELRLIEIHIEPMRSEEQAVYHSWYQQQTKARVPITNEPILVAAAWIYELRRQADVSPEAFAVRFYARLEELGLRTPARAALALNQFGLRAPGKLFAGCEAQLDQLISEQIYRLVHPDTGTRRGRFFHPRIAKIIYDAIVPESELHSRAEDLAHAFGVMFDEAEAAGTFLTWLDAPRTQSRIAPLLKKEILAVIWSVFRARGPRQDDVSLLRRWYEMARAAGVHVADIGAARQILEWFNATLEDASSWGLLFQIVWEEADEAYRDVLYARGEAWLGRNSDSSAWNWIWQQLWTHRPKKRELLDLGFLWLHNNLSHHGWGRVWQHIFDSDVREPDLLMTALEALPRQPESSADLPIWQKVESLGPEKTEFLGAILQKLVQVRSPYKMDQGVDFIRSRVGDAPLSEILSHAIADAAADAGWPHLWLVLTRKCVGERPLLEMGRNWLAGREDRPEWAFVWQRLVELDFESDKLLPTGHDWLAGREDRPEYPYVYRWIHGAGRR